MASPQSEPTKDSTVVTENLTNDELSQLGITGGVKVTGVEGSSNAYGAGLRRGMIIVSVNHEQVNDTAEFQEKFDAVKKKDVVVLQVYSRGKNNFIAFDKD